MLLMKVSVLFFPYIILILKTQPWVTLKLVISFNITQLITFFLGACQIPLPGSQGPESLDDDHYSTTLQSQGASQLHLESQLVTFPADAACEGLCTFLP